MNPINPLSDSLSIVSPTPPPDPRPSSSRTTKKPSPPDQTIRPKRFDSLLKHRFHKLFKEEDILGKTVAQLYAALQGNTGDSAALRKVLSSCLLPADLINLQGQASVRTELLRSTLKPIEQKIGVLQHLLPSFQEAAQAPIRSGICRLIQYYEDFSRSFSEANPDQRQKKLESKAQVSGDSIGFYLIDQSTARRIRCVDSCGFTQKENEFGNHPVTCIRNIHFKPNPLRDYIGPGSEFMWGAFCQLFSDKMIVAPTSLIKIRNVDTKPLHDRGVQAEEGTYDAFMLLRQQGLSSDKIFLDYPDLEGYLSRYSCREERVVQAGFTIGDPAAKYPTAISLLDLLQFVELFDSVKACLGEMTFVQTLPQLVQYTKTPVKQDSRSLLNGYLHFMRSIASKDRCIEFKNPEDLTEVERNQVHTFMTMTSERQMLRFQRYLTEKDATTWASLLAILRVHPDLMKNRSLTDLINLPKLFRYIPLLMPNRPASEIVQKFPQLLNKIDSSSFAGLVVGSIITRANDGKGDNFFAILERDEQTRQISTIHIIGIDMDRADAPVFSTNRIDPGHNVEMKCVLFALPMMKQPIPTSLRTLLLSSSPEKLLIQWLTQLDERNEAYLRLIQQQVLTSDDLQGTDDKLDVPLTLSPKFLPRAYKQLCQARAIAEDPHPKTLNDLFQVLDPVVYLFYQELIHQSKTPLKVQHRLFRDYSATVEKIVGSSTRIASEGCTVQEYLVKNKGTRVQCSLPEAVQILLKELSFSKLDIPTITLAKQFSELACVTHLPVTKKQAQKLLSHAVQQGWSDLVTVAIASGADVGVADASGQTPLHKLCKIGWYYRRDSAEVVKIAKTLFSHPLDVNRYDDTKLTPLLHLVDGAHHDRKLARTLLVYLVSNGVDMELKDPEHQETPLDRAIRRNKPTTFIDLINQGAGKYVDPKKAIQFAQANASEEMDQALKTLQGISNEVAWHFTLSGITQPDKPTTAFELKGVHTGVVYLRPEILSRIKFDRSGHFSAQQSEKYGRRTVLPITYQDPVTGEEYRAHFKANPELPGTERAVYKLIQRLIGHSVTPTELFRVYAKGSAYPLLASKTVVGPTLQEVLTDLTNSRVFDSHRLHNIILAAMLSNFEDGNPGNFIVTNYLKDSYQIVCIDTDHAFIKSFVRQRRRKRLLIKCILFCLSQMKDKIHPKSRTLLLKFDPYTLLSEWLKGLMADQKHYDTLFNEQEKKNLYKKHRNNPSVIPILFPPSAIAELLERCQNLQREMRNNPNATLFDVFSAVVPSVAKEYKKAFEEADTPMERFDYIFREAGLKPKAGCYTSQYTSRDILRTHQIPESAIYQSQESYHPTQALSELQYIYKQQQTIQKVRQDLLRGDTTSFRELRLHDYRQRVIAQIDFAQANHQAAIFQAIEESETTFRHLSLKGSKIDDKSLQRILTHSPNLISLDLSNCTELTSKVIPFIAKNCHALKELNLTGWQEATTLGFRRRRRLVKFSLLSRLIIDKSAFTQLKIETPNLRQLSLEGCQNVRELSLIDLNPEQLNCKGCSNLVNIKIPSTDLMSRRFVFRPKLTHLSLENCSNLPTKTIENVVGWADELQDLNVKGCSQLQHHPFYERIQENPSLLLASAKSSQESAKVWQILAEAETNTEIKLNSMEITSRQVAAIAGLLASSRVTSLSLWGCSLGDDKAETIANVLARNTSVKIVCFDSNDISDEGAAAMARMLSHNSVITTLELMSNQIGPTGAIAIAKALDGHPSLTRLDISSNVIEDRGAVAFAEVIQRNSPLKDLNLGGNERYGFNRIGAHGIAAVAEALKYNSRIRFIDVGDKVLTNIQGRITSTHRGKEYRTRNGNDIQSMMISTHRGKEYRTRNGNDIHSMEMGSTYPIRQEASTSSGESRRGATPSKGKQPARSWVGTSQDSTTSVRSDQTLISSFRRSVGPTLDKTSLIPNEEMSRRIAAVNRLLLAFYPSNALSSLNLKNQRSLMRIRNHLIDFRQKEFFTQRDGSDLDRIIQQLVQRGRIKCHIDWVMFRLTKRFTECGGNTPFEQIQELSCYITDLAFQLWIPMPFHGRIWNAYIEKHHNQTNTGETHSSKGKERIK